MRLLIYLGVLDYIAIMLIIFVGVPHGAFDASVGMTLGFINNGNQNYLLLFHI